MKDEANGNAGGASDAGERKNPGAMKRNENEQSNGEKRKGPRSDSPSEDNKPAATKPRIRPSKNEREIAEALFNLATLAADVDTGGGTKKNASKRPKKRTVTNVAQEKTTSGVNTVTIPPTIGDMGGVSNTVAGYELAYGVGAPISGPVDYSAQYGASAVNRYGVSFVPRGKPFQNSALHVYIAHFIDLTQQAAKQQTLVHQELAAHLSGSIGNAPSPSDVGALMAHAQEAGTSGVGVFGAASGLPFVTPHAMAAMMSGQPGGGAPDMQQVQFINMMMQYAAAFPMFGAPPGFGPPAQGGHDGVAAMGGTGGVSSNMFFPPMPFTPGVQSGAKDTTGMPPSMMDPRAHPMMMAMMSGMMPPQMTAPSMQPTHGTAGDIAKDVATAATAAK